MREQKQQFAVCTHTRTHTGTHLCVLLLPDLAEVPDVEAPIRPARREHRLTTHVLTFRVTVRVITFRVTVRVITRKPLLTTHVFTFKMACVRGRSNTTVTGMVYATVKHTRDTHMLAQTTPNEDPRTLRARERDGDLNGAHSTQKIWSWWDSKECSRLLRLRRSQSPTVCVGVYV